MTESGDRLKLHRHAVRLGGVPYTVITPRPGAGPRFSDNCYHGTWHVLSDRAGARLLARLLWGLAYQRVPRTLVLIGPPRLDPSPFSAARADPIALVPLPLTPLPAGAARELRARLPLGAPDGTVRWHTPGLDRAIAAGPARVSRAARAAAARDRRHRVHHVGRRGGLVVVAATAPVLRDWAVDLDGLSKYPWHGMDWTELGYSGREDGEVQVFTDYAERVAAARAARRQVLAERPASRAEADLDPLIWARAARLRNLAAAGAGSAR